MLVKKIICTTCLFWSFFSHAQNSDVGVSVYGDFDGDFSKEYAFIVETSSPTVDSTGKSTPGEYSIMFSINKLGEIKVGCCQIQIILEGDLDQNGTTEISIYKKASNQHTITTYTYSSSKWQVLIPTFTISSNANMTKSELLDKVYTKNGEIYYVDSESSTTPSILTKS